MMLTGEVWVTGWPLGSSVPERIPTLALSGLCHSLLVSLGLLGVAVLNRYEEHGACADAGYAFTPARHSPKQRTLVG